MKKIFNVLLVLVMMSFVISACSVKGKNKIKKAELNIGGVTYTVSSSVFPTILENKYGTYKISDFTIAKGTNYGEVYIYLDCEIVELKDAIFGSFPKIFWSNDINDNINNGHVLVKQSIGSDFITNAGKGDKFNVVYISYIATWGDGIKDIYLVGIKDGMEG